MIVAFKTLDGLVALMDVPHIKDPDKDRRTVRILQPRSGWDYGNPHAPVPDHFHYRSYHFNGKFYTPPIQNKPRGSFPLYEEQALEEAK